MQPMPASGSPQAGEVREASRGEAIARLAETPHIILNAPLVGQRLGYADVSGLDLLELFAFVHPARFAVPTVAGLARAVGVDAAGRRCHAAAATADQIAEALLASLADPEWPEREGAWTANATLHRLGWSWAPFVGQRLAKPERGERMLFSRLPQWEEQARAAAAQDHLHSPRRRRGEAGRTDRQGIRAARGAAGDGRRSRRDLRAAPRDGRAQHAAGRGRNGHRQDAGLSRSGLAVGGAGAGDGVGFDLHQGACSGSSMPRAGGSSRAQRSASDGS